MVASCDLMNSSKFIVTCPASSKSVFMMLDSNLLAAVFTFLLREISISINRVMVFTQIPYVSWKAAYSAFDFRLWASRRISVWVQKIMLSMRAAKHKILRSIIILNFIDVVNNLGIRKKSSNLALHDKPMFHDVSLNRLWMVFFKNKNVTGLTLSSSAFPRFEFFRIGPNIFKVASPASFYNLSDAFGFYFMSAY